VARITQRIHWNTPQETIKNFGFKNSLGRENFHPVCPKHKIEIDAFEDLCVVSKYHHWSGDPENVSRVIPKTVDKIRFLRNNRKVPDLQKLLSLNLRGVCHVFDAVLEWLFHPTLSALLEDQLEIAFKKSAGVLEVLFGVGFGDGEARKRFVEQGYDSLLLGEWGHRYWSLAKVASANPVALRAGAFLGDCGEGNVRLRVKVEKPREKPLRIEAKNCAINGGNHPLSGVWQNPTSPHGLRQARNEAVTLDDFSAAQTLECRFRNVAGFLGSVFEDAFADIAGLSEADAFG
jgi:hypothetical protein